MMIKIIEDNFNPIIYNKLATHPLQSWEWGDARKKMGIEVVRFGEYVNKQISNKQMRNVYQMTLHKIPYTKYKIGYLPRSKFPSKAVLDFITDYSRNNNIVFVKIEPNVLKSQIPNLKSQSSSNFKFQISKHPLFPEWTIVLDLNKSEEELFNNLKSKTRYNIRLAQKKAVIVKEESNEKGFEIFSKLYFETCRRQKYHGHSPHYHKIIWDTLKNNISRVLIAYYQNTPLAAYELFYFNKTFYYPYGGTSLEYRNLMSSNLLMWEAVKMGKKLGADKFDMWGSLPPNYDPAHSWAGFTRFKEGYNGKYTQMIGSYDIVINPVIYSLYNFTASVREKYLGLRRG